MSKVGDAPAVYLTYPIIGSSAGVAGPVLGTRTPTPGTTCILAALGIPISRRGEGREAYDAPLH